MNSYRLHWTNIYVLITYNVFFQSVILLEFELMRSFKLHFSQLFGCSCEHFLYIRFPFFCHFWWISTEVFGVYFCAWTLNLNTSVNISFLYSFAFIFLKLIFLISCSKAPDLFLLNLAYYLVIIWGKKLIKWQNWVMLTFFNRKWKSRSWVKNDFVIDLRPYFLDPNHESMVL